MKCNNKKYNIVVPKWPKKVVIGHTRDSYYTKSAKIPKKHAINASLKKFGKDKWYWVDQKTNKRVIKKEGGDTYWNFNGQGFYTGTIHWTTRTKIVNFYHRLFIKQIKKYVKDNIPACLGYSLSVSVDIYDIFNSHTPDIGNMGWLLLKLFEDSLQEAGVLREDSPEYIMESGRSRYHWVEDEDKRKLIFRIKYIKL
ncbi:MAG: hypothetical protein KAH32_05575 [Chlamydiia bacterium]|nr:hypothetical protein [Chlamydiia bacterium]